MIVKLEINNCGSCPFYKKICDEVYCRHRNAINYGYIIESYHEISKDCPLLNFQLKE